MSSINNYMFENMSRTGEDVTTLSEKNKQNTTYGSYQLTNYFLKECDMKRPIEIATSQPNVYVVGGKNTVGMGGCAVDNDTTLRHKSLQTTYKGRVSLFPRPFVSVPYLGRGSVNIEDELRLKQGERISNRKTAHGLSEGSLLEHHHYPLIDSIRNSVTNPNNLIESSASNDWVRGGANSRESSKQYLNTNK